MHEVNEDEDVEEEDTEEDAEEEGEQEVGVVAEPGSTAAEPTTEDAVN